MFRKYFVGYIVLSPSFSCSFVKTSTLDTFLGLPCYIELVTTPPFFHVMNEKCSFRS